MTRELERSPKPTARLRQLADSRLARWTELKHRLMVMSGLAKFLEARVH